MCGAASPHQAAIRSKLGCLAPRCALRRTLGLTVAAGYRYEYDPEQVRYVARLATFSHPRFDRNTLMLSRTNWTTHAMRSMAEREWSC